MQKKVIGLTWDESTLDERYMTLYTMFPNGVVYTNPTMAVMYDPKPSSKTVDLAMNVEVVQQVSRESLDTLNAYRLSVTKKLSNPIKWSHTQLRLPVQEICNIKTGTFGTEAVTRIEWQILDILISLYGKSPGFDISKLFKKVKQIAAIHIDEESNMDTWSKQIEQAICKLNPNTLTRNCSARISAISSTHEKEVDKVYSESDEPNLDLLPKQLTFLISDVSTKSEAKFVRRLDGIMVHIGEPQSFYKKGDIILDRSDAHSYIESLNQIAREGM